MTYWKDEDKISGTMTIQQRQSQSYSLHVKLRVIPSGTTAEVVYCKTLRWEGVFQCITV